MIYLASDSYVVKELAEEMFPERMVTIDTQLQHVAMLETNGNPKKSSSKFVEGDKKELIDGSIGMWVDYILLARSYAAVVPLSGFSTHAINTCAIPVKRLFQVPHCNKLQSLYPHGVHIEKQ